MNYDVTSVEYAKAWISFIDKILSLYNNISEILPYDLSIDNIISNLQKAKISINNRLYIYDQLASAIGYDVNRLAYKCLNFVNGNCFYEAYANFENIISPVGIVYNFPCGLNSFCRSKSVKEVKADVAPNKMCMGENSRELLL